MIGRTSRIVLEAVAASLIGLVVIAAAVAWRLSQGPVSLAFLTPEIEEALNAEGGAVRVRIRDTIIAWAGWARPLDVRVVGVRVVARDGRTVVSVPEVSVRFSARALVAGVIAPTSLELVGPRIRLVRARGGGIELALADGGSASGEAFAGLVEAIGAPPSPDRPISYLSRIGVLAAELVIDDRMTGTVWGAPRADLVLFRRGGLVQAEFGIDLDMGGGTVRVDGTAAWRKGEERIAVEASVAGLRPDRLAAKLPRLGRAGALRLPLAGTVQALIGDGRLVSARFDLGGTDGRLEMAELWPQGLAVKSFKAEGRFDADPDRLAINALTVDLDGPTVSVRGSAVRIDERIAIDGSATLRRMPVSALGHFWPESLAPRPRKWITENMGDGEVSEARLDISLRTAPGSDTPAVEAISGSMRIDGTSVRFLDGLPPARWVDATAAFARDRFIISIHGGALDGLRIDSGTVRLTALDTDRERAAIETVVRGPLPKVLDLIDRPRLGYARAFGVVPGRTAGEAAVRLVVTLPLTADVTFADVDMAAAANLRGVSVPGIAFGKDVDDGALTLRVDRKAMSIEGTATVAGTPVRIRWYEAFGARPGLRRRYEVKGTFDDRGRAALGLGFAPWVRGPVEVDLSLSEEADGRGRAAVRLGLKPATLALPWFGWTKPPGRDGAAFLTLVLDSRRLAAVPDFSLATPDLRASGAVRFGPDGRLAAVDLKRLRLGATDIAGSVRARADGGFDIDVRGPGFDAAPLLRGAGAEAGADALPPLAVTARFERLWFSTGPPVEKARGRLVYDGKAWREMEIAAALDERQQVSLRLDGAGTGRRFSFTASDAGSALRALDIADTVTGGRLVLTAMRDAGPAAPWRGTAVLNGINVVRAPILARLLSLASLTGIVNALSGKGIAFARVEVPLTYVPGDRVVRIENARAVGSELGLTANGEVDIGRERLRLEGTIAPAYTINSVLGNIPLLGDLLTGAKGSGVFAATYRMEGPLQDPKVTVNPLAALAPGFLRNLLGVFEGFGRDAERPAAEPPARRP